MKLSNSKLYLLHFNMNFWIDHYTATLVTLVATVVDPNGTFLCRISSTKVYTSRSCSLLDVHQSLVGSKKNHQITRSTNSSNHKVPSGNKTTLETHPDSTEDTEDTRDMEAQASWIGPCLWNCVARWPLTPRKGNASLRMVYVMGFLGRI